MSDPDNDRFWLKTERCEHGRWVWPQDVERALDAAQLAVNEYYNGDRDTATLWLIKALEASDS